MSEQAKLFCPNCGHEVQPDNKFCKNCGFKIAEYIAKQNAKNTSNTDAKPEAKAPATKPVAAAKAPVAKPAPTATRVGKSHPMNKKKKAGLIAAAVVLVLLIGGYVAGKKYYSAENQLDRAVKAIGKGDASSSLSYLSTNDVKLKLDKTTIKPLLNYYETHARALNDLATTTRNGGEGTMKFAQSGHRLLVFPAYKFNVSAVYPKVTTNEKGTKVTVSNAPSAGFTGKADARDIGPLVPGSYTLKATAKISGKKTSTKIKSDLLEDDSIDLSFQTVSVTVDGYPGAEVRINGAKVGNIDEYGQLQINKYPIVSSSKLTEVYDPKGAAVESRAVKLADGYDNGEITLGYPGVISHANADSLIYNLINDADYLANNGDDTDTEDQMKDMFVNGADNEDYQQFVKMAVGYYKNDNIDSVSMTSDFKHVYPKAKDKAKVVANVEYDFDNTDADSTHVQVFQYEGEVDKVGTDDYRIVNFKISKKVSDEHQAY